MTLCPDDHASRFYPAAFSRDTLDHMNTKRSNATQRVILLVAAFLKAAARDHYPLSMQPPKGGYRVSGRLSALQ
ncbi:hypothetical protein KCP75_24045 [Salmonella enterica subsp. enterica]|nr:hypothetical protein KCP75_24045 [Salmonella enterica subsp. enterica]